MLQYHFWDNLPQSCKQASLWKNTEQKIPSRFKKTMVVLRLKSICNLWWAWAILSIKGTVFKATFFFFYHNSGTKSNNLMPKNLLPNSGSSQPRTTCPLSIWTPTPEPPTFASSCANKKVLFTAWDLRQWKAFNSFRCSWIKHQETKTEQYKLR